MKQNENIKTEWQTVSIETLIDFYIKGFELPPNHRIFYHESYLDAAKGKLALKLFINTDVEEKAKGA